MLLIATLLFGLAEAPRVVADVDTDACEPRQAPWHRPAFDPPPTLVRLYPMSVDAARAQLPGVCASLSWRGHARVVAQGLVVEDERAYLPPVP